MPYSTKDLEDYTRRTGTRGYSLFLTSEGWSANVRTGNGWHCGQGYYPTAEAALAQFLDPKPPEKPARRRRDLI